MLKCCAPVLRTASYPRQFGEGEDDVFAGDIVPKTLELCAETKHEVLRTALLLSVGRGHSCTG